MYASSIKISDKENHFFNIMKGFGGIENHFILFVTISKLRNALMNLMLGCKIKANCLRVGIGPVRGSAFCGGSSYVNELVPIHPKTSEFICPSLWNN